MSDFSQICPIFSTGVYSEVTFNNITFSSISTTHNALVGAKTRATKPGSFKFGRTVVVTKIYIQKQDAPGTKPILYAKRHKATGTAVGTIFATHAVVSITSAKDPLGRIKAMTTAAKTFLAADVLGFSVKTLKTDPGKYSFIVRYKEA
jgi:hypothetical protein